MQAKYPTGLRKKENIMKKLLTILLVVLVLTLALVSCFVGSQTTTTTTTTTTTVEYCKHDDPTKIIVVEAKAPTCQETGFTEGMKCLECETMVVPQRIIEIIDCIESDWIVDKESTYTEEGVKHIECIMCGETLSKVTIPVAKVYVRDGDYIYFGEYPQTIKAVDVEITETQDSRGYYLGSDGSYYAMIIATPYGADYCFSTETTIISGIVYYFKVEPIRWRILSEENGEVFLLCDSIIANVAYQTDYYNIYEDIGYRTYTNANGAPSGTYANNYKYSNARAWLNSTFYEAAFSEIERSFILTTEVDNSVASTGITDNNYIYDYICENTNDKLFLLSYAEATNSEYGFINNESRLMSPSDYARAKGAHMTYWPNDYGYWYLRSPYVVDTRAISYNGSTNCLHGSCHKDGNIVPALRMKL